MGHFGALSPKREVVYSNNHKIINFDKGRWKKNQTAEVEVTKVRVNAKGKKKVSGGKDLKMTQRNPCFSEAFSFVS